MPSPLLASVHKYLTTNNANNNNNESADESVVPRSGSKQSRLAETSPATESNSSLCSPSLSAKAAPRASRPMVHGTPTNPLLHALFLWGTAAGHEIFYIIAMPLFYWTMDPIIARRFLIVWVVIYCMGQALKDLLRLPRPPSPPVLRMSAIYEAEFGMPSTHAMGAVAVAFNLVFSFWKSGYDINFWWGLSIATIHTVVVCLSRLYMGAHSVPDLVVGLSLSSITCAFFVIVGDDLDVWLATSSWVPIIVPMLAAGFLAIYPKSSSWSESYGDTATIVGVATGSMLGIWTIGVPPMGPMPEEPKPIMITISFSVLLIQCVIGFILVLGTRAIVKTLMLRILPSLLLPHPSNAHLHPHINFENVYQNYCIEIPTKLLTYSSIGFNATFIAPLVCTQLLVALA